MGWCTGSYIANDVWNLVRDYIPESERKVKAEAIIELFSNYDADCWEEGMNICRDSET